MRIACVYLPSFPLQVHVRLAPHRSGTAFAVVHGPRDEEGELSFARRRLLVCSKAAWTLGVRRGMSAPQARALAPEVELVPSDPTLYQRALEALAEAFLALSVTVDIGDPKAPPAAHRCIYLRVPTKARGDSFGHKLLAQLDRQGFRARVGIADNRFTAWVAAQSSKPKDELFTPECTVIPRGGAAAFLAPQSIDLLALDPEVQHMLETLGVRTLGDFAALPPPSVGRRWNEEGVDYQSLARGEGPTLLRGFTPQDSPRERVELDCELSDLEPIAFTLRPLADRICDRLRGRGMALGKALLRLEGRGDQGTELDIEPHRATAEGRVLFDRLRAALSDGRLAHPVSAIELTVTRESDPEFEELDLFDRRDSRASSQAVDAAIARIEAMFGEEAAASAQLLDSHRPERSFQITPFSPPKRPQRTRKKRRQHGRKCSPGQAELPLAMNGLTGAMRLIEPPQPQSKRLDRITVSGKAHAVVASRGPTRIDTEWWTEAPVERDYYEVETDEGGRYWVFHKKSEDRFYLHGIFD